MGFKTTIIVGAGASFEYKLPLGNTLRSQIASLLNFKKDRFGRLTESTGDQLVSEAIISHARGDQSVVDSCYNASYTISTAMPQAESIDTFIDAHRENSALETCGKLAIARAILTAEGQSSLFVDPTEYDQKINFQRIENTWLNKLMRRITQGKTLDELEQHLNDLTFIVFNYDRCVEHFIMHWLKDYYWIDDDIASSMVEKIKIYHPYGIVGELPWTGTSFGASINAKQLINIASQLRTYSEGTSKPDNEIEMMRQRYSESRHVIFLGFAFHRQNILLLRSNFGPVPNRTCFSTAIGLSEYECSLIEPELQQTVNSPMKDIYMRRDLDCTRLIDEYGRSLILG